MPERIERTRLSCRNALDQRPLAAVETSFSRLGITEQRLAEAVRASAAEKKATADFVAMRDLVNRELQLDAEAAAFERTALLRTVLQNLDGVPHLPVDESVQQLFCRDFNFYATAAECDLKSFRISSGDYYSRLRVALLQRFPAGQSEWEVSGFPRGWLLKVAPADLPRTLFFFATKLKGFAPMFVGHLSSGRRSPFLLERDFRLGFYRSALAIERQPHVRGSMAVSWLHSRETHRVSPHLAFLNRPFMEAGGLYVDLGPASLSDGFTEGDPHRVELYTRGEYKPTTALVVCTREQLIAWKEKNHDLEPLLQTKR